MKYIFGGSPIPSTTGDALRCSTSKQDQRLVEKHLEKFPSVLATFCLQSTGRNFQECVLRACHQGESFPLLKGPGILKSGLRVLVGVFKKKKFKILVLN